MNSGNGHHQHRRPGRPTNTMWSTAAAAAQQPATNAAAPTLAAVLLALGLVALTTLVLILLQRLRQRGSGVDTGRRGKGLPKSVARAAYESLRTRELAWLRNLPPQTQAALTATAASNGFGKGGEKRRPLSAGVDGALAVFSGEVGMVLLGVKPCVVVEDRGGLPGFGEAHAEEVLRPWVEEFSLTDYGFVLTHVASACAPPEIRGHRGFKGAGLFYWKLHPEASFVESIFGGEHPSMPGRLLGEALGYPGREGRLAVEIMYLSLETLPYGPWAASPSSLPPLAEGDDEDGEEEDDEDDNDDDGQAALPPHSTTANGGPTAQPRVPLLRYVGREEDGQRIGAHFRRVGEAFMAVFEQPLALDLGACEGWDAGALAKLLVAAFPSAFDHEEEGSGGELGGLLRCLESGALVPHPWMRERFPELPPIVRMLRLVEKLQREKEQEAVAAGSRRW